MLSVQNRFLNYIYLVCVSDVWEAASLGHGMVRKQLVGISSLLPPLGIEFRQTALPAEPYIALAVCKVVNSEVSEIQIHYINNPIILYASSIRFLLLWGFSYFIVI